MSELTPCNHCTLERIKGRAEARGASVIVQRQPVLTEMGGWYAVIVSDEPKPVAYFMELTVGCAC
jgi:hypothetical protein